MIVDHLLRGWSSSILLFRANPPLSFDHLHQNECPSKWRKQNKLKQHQKPSRIMGFSLHMYHPSHLKMTVSKQQHLVFYLFFRGVYFSASGWFSHIWRLCSSNWIISKIWEESKNNWNHQHVVRLFRHAFLLGDVLASIQVERSFRTKLRLGESAVEKAQRLFHHWPAWINYWNYLSDIPRFLGIGSNIERFPLVDWGPVVLSF